MQSLSNFQQSSRINKLTLKSIMKWERSRTVKEILKEKKENKVGRLSVHKCETLL